MLRVAVRQNRIADKVVELAAGAAESLGV